MKKIITLILTTSLVLIFAICLRGNVVSDSVNEKSETNSPQINIAQEVLPVDNKTHVKPVMMDFRTTNTPLSNTYANYSSDYKNAKTGYISMLHPDGENMFSFMLNQKSESTEERNAAIKKMLIFVLAITLMLTLIGRFGGGLVPDATTENGKADLPQDVSQ